MPSDHPGGRAASGYIMREWTEKADFSDGGRRLDVFWQGCLDEEGVPRARIQDWIRQGRAAINDQVCAEACISAGVRHPPCKRPFRGVSYQNLHTQ